MGKTEGLRAARVIDEPYAVLKELRRLMYAQAPVRVVVDESLPAGAWFVVRAAKPEDIARGRSNEGR